MSNKGHSNSGGRSHGMSHQGLSNRHNDFSDDDNEDCSEDIKNKKHSVLCSYCKEWMTEDDYDNHLNKCVKNWEDRKGITKAKMKLIEG